MANENTTTPERLLPDREAVREARKWLRLETEIAPLTPGEPVAVIAALDLAEYLGRDEVQRALQNARAARLAKPSIDHANQQDDLNRLRPLLYDREEENRG